MKNSVKSVFPKPVFILSALRSPIGKFGGALSKLSAAELAGITLKMALEKNAERSFPQNCDHVFLGHARQAGAGPNPARQAALYAGLSEKIPAMTLNQACSSGLQAVICGLDKLALGRSQFVWAGGVESMSNTPYFLTQARFGQRLGHAEVLDGMWKDGFFCPMSQMLMGETVEKYLVPEFSITRKEQDECAFFSQQKAQKAFESGFIKDEFFELKEESKKINLNFDEHRKPETTLKKLSELPSVFDKKNGSITAGNSSGITDGAAFLSLSNQNPNGKALAEVLDYEVIALEPQKMGLGPVYSTLNLLNRHGLKVNDLESVELNEAFAAQVIACQRTLKIPEEKLNPRGGAIALGHPIGATGARILVSLVHTLKGKKGALGIATLCVSGGHGVAVLIRAV